MADPTVVQLIIDNPPPRHLSWFTDFSSYPECYFRVARNNRLLTLTAGYGGLDPVLASERLEQCANELETNLPLPPIRSQSLTPGTSPSIRFLRFSFIFAYLCFNLRSTFFYSEPMIPILFCYFGVPFLLCCIVMLWYNRTEEPCTVSAIVLDFDQNMMFTNSADMYCELLNFGVFVLLHHISLMNRFLTRII